MSKCVVQWSCNMHQLCYCFVIIFFFAIFKEEKSFRNTFKIINNSSIFYYSLFHFALFDGLFLLFSFIKSILNAFELIFTIQKINRFISQWIDSLVNISIVFQSNLIGQAITAITIRSNGVIRSTNYNQLG